MPAIGVDLDVIGVGLSDDGAMVVPKSRFTAGWYRFGARPSDRGATVITAHVDTPDGLGPLAALPSVEPGDRVVVGTEDGPVRYRIERVGRVPKDKLDLESLFSRSGPSRLHIVTCGGPFDDASGTYRDNVVALALPMKPSRR